MCELADAQPQQGRYGSGSLFTSTVPDYLIMNLCDLVGKDGEHRELTRGVEVGVVDEPVQSRAEVFRVGPELQLVEIIGDHGIGVEGGGFLG